MITKETYYTLSSLIKKQIKNNKQGILKYKNTFGIDDSEKEWNRMAKSTLENENIRLYQALNEIENEV